MNTVSTTVALWHRQTQPDALLNDWLFNQDSLTQRLTQLSNDSFSVQLLREGWQTLRADECKALRCAVDSTGWVREVFLRGRQQPWVYARSVANQASLQNSGFDLASLGTRSLGEFLFSEPGMQRGAIEICTLPADLLPEKVLSFTGQAGTLWARRSCFSRTSLNILVSEAFLPAFWQQLATQ